MNKLVSVVVTTLNNEATLERCLISISNQSYKNFEIIVVDRHSTDKTKEIAKKYTSLVFDKEPERSAQRNFGVNKSRGEFILIIDSDMELTSDVISDCLSKTKSVEVGGVVIPEESVGTGFWSKCKSLERSYYQGVDWMEAARFYRKKLYDKVGGFDENLISGEDWDLSQRIRQVSKLARASSLIYHDEGRITLLRLVQKKFYYAKHFNEYLKKAHTGNEAQTSILQRYGLFFSRPKDIFQHPIIWGSMIFMKTLEFMFGGLGLVYYGFIYGK